ncbi:MAG: Hsp20/alpha crystallin family protein [Chloroflexota bacterium]
MSIVIRRNPIREMAAMQNAMDRLFEDTWRGMGLNAEADNTLAIDVHENDEAYTLLANVPGANPANIEITLHDSVLTINADLPQADVEDGTRVHINERVSGTYVRSLRLPKAVDASAVEAAYENGVLVLTLPKTPDAQPRQIPIRNGAAALTE